MTKHNIIRDQYETHQYYAVGAKIEWEFKGLAWNTSFTEALEIWTDKMDAEHVLVREAVMTYEPMPDRPDIYKVTATYYDENDNKGSETHIVAIAP